MSRNKIPPAPHAEPMVDARTASASLALPYYWFADPKMRAKHRIPHYQLGSLVRFRLSELERWSVQFGTIRHGEGES